MSEYVCQSVGTADANGNIPCTTWLQVDATSQIDYTYLSQIWAFAFSGILILFFMSLGIAKVVGMIRRA